MRLFILTALTMVAFASNSVLNRAALAGGEAGPAAFALLRLLSGAVCLAGLALWQSGFPKLTARKRVIGSLSLAIYMLGFSFAYVVLDAGAGALILFGGVQITMFIGALFLGERPAPARWVGSAVAFAGLAWLLWPGEVTAPPLGAAGLMASAAFGWGVYSLAGRGATNPLGETAGNFICAAPLALLVWFALPDGMTASGAALAVTSGAVTSGLGYALWYWVLPKLDASVAALAQLTAPVIAILGGTLFLAEVPETRLLLASAVVLGGVAFGVISGRKKP